MDFTLGTLGRNDGRSGMTSLGALDYPNCGTKYPTLIGSDANVDSIIVPATVYVGNHTSEWLVELVARKIIIVASPTVLATIPAGAGHLSGTCLEPTCQS